MIGIAACSAILASATVFARSSLTGTSLTVWNRPVWCPATDNGITRIEEHPLRRLARACACRRCPEVPILRASRSECGR